jgi:hypothetical protein
VGGLAGEAPCRASWAKTAVTKPERESKPQSLRWKAVGDGRGGIRQGLGGQPPYLVPHRLALINRSVHGRNPVDPVDKPS